MIKTDSYKSNNVLTNLWTYISGTLPKYFKSRKLWDLVKGNQMYRGNVSMDGRPISDTRCSWCECISGGAAVDLL